MMNWIHKFIIVIQDAQMVIFKIKINFLSPIVRCLFMFQISFFGVLRGRCDKNNFSGYN